MKGDNHRQTRTRSPLKDAQDAVPLKRFRVMADVKARGYTDVLAPSWEVAHNLAVANGKLSGAASFTLPKKWTYEVEIDSECIIEVAAKDDFDPVNGT